MVVVGRGEETAGRDDEGYKWARTDFRDNPPFTPKPSQVGTLSPIQPKPCQGCCTVGPRERPLPSLLSGLPLFLQLRPSTLQFGDRLLPLNRWLGRELSWLSPLSLQLGSVLGAMSE